MENENQKVTSFGKIKLAFLIVILIVIIFIVGIIFIKKQTQNNYEYEVMQSTTGGINTGSNLENNSGQLIQSGTVSSNEQEVLAYISDFSGDVGKILNKVKKNIEKGDILSQGDTLITGSDGQVSIVFTNNSVIRLNNNSKIVFKKINKQNTEIDLNTGELWGRILKPFYDSSFFTINTSDISAGVRGTSLFLKKIDKNTKLEVIDSFAENKDKEGAIVKYINPETNKEEEEIIKPEKSITLNKEEKIIERANVLLNEVYKTPFKLLNTQKDIVYMDELQKNNKDQNLIKKVSGELTATLPEKNEINVFFKEQAIKDEIGKIYTGNKSPSVEEFVNNIKKDFIIQDIRQQVAEKISKIIDKKQLIAIQIRENQEIQNIIKGNMKQVDIIFKKELYNIIKKDKEKILYLSGSNLVPLNKIDIKNRDEGAIKERNIIVNRIIGGQINKDGEIIPINTQSGETSKLPTTIPKSTVPNQ